MSPQSFPRFLELPTELKILIWQFAMRSADAVSEARGLIGNSFADDTHRPVLEGPHSGNIVHVYLLSEMRPFLRIMNSCRIFRVLCLDYWRGEAKKFWERWSPALLEGGPRRRGRIVLEVLEECIEQMRRPMVTDAQKAGG